jgi:hypothetical protein
MQLEIVGNGRWVSMGRERHSELGRFLSFTKPAAQKRVTSSRASGSQVLDSIAVQRGLDRPSASVNDGRCAHQERGIVITMVMSGSGAVESSFPRVKTIASSMYEGRSMAATYTGYQLSAHASTATTKRGTNILVLYGQFSKSHYALVVLEE